MAKLILYYITDRMQFPGEEAVRQERLLECVAAAARAGVDYIQLREKDLSAAALEALARAAVERVRGVGRRTRLLINSNFGVAAAVGADGVHLPAGIAVAPVRASLGERGAGGVIGVSCHTREEVLHARDEGADFAVFGPVFEKGGLGKGPLEKSGGAGLGMNRLREACGAAKGWPVLALGGVTAENAAACVPAGATGVAGIRLFQRGDISQTVAVLRAIPG